MVDALHVAELHGLYRDLFNALVRSKPGSAERGTCLASLANIVAEINLRLTPVTSHGVA